MEKQMFGKQMFAGSCRDNGTQSGSDLQTHISSMTPSPYSLLIPLVTVLFQKQVLYLSYFRQLRGGSKFLPESLSLDCFQLEIICMHKARFGIRCYKYFKSIDSTFIRHSTYSDTNKLVLCLEFLFQKILTKNNKFYCLTSLISLVKLH